MYRHYVSSSKIDKLKDYLEERRKSWPRHRYYFGQSVIDHEAKLILEKTNYTDEEEQLRDMLVSLQANLKAHKAQQWDSMDSADKRGQRLMYQDVQELIDEIKTLLGEKE